MAWTLFQQNVGFAPNPRAAWLRGIAFGLACVIFIIDALTPLDVAIAVLYVVVILLIAMTGNRKLTLYIGMTCIALTVVGYLLPHFAIYSAQATARSAVGLLAIVTTLFLSMRNLSNTAMVLEKVKLLELSHDAIVVHHLDGIVQSWNRGAHALYGRTESDAIGRPLHQLLGTTFPQSWETIQQSLHATGQWDGQLLQHRSDGTLVTVESRWSLLRDPQGNAQAVLTTNNDITERVRAECGMARSEAFLAEAQYLSRTGSVAIRFPAQKVWHSIEAGRILEVPEGHMASFSSITSLIHSEDIRKVFPTYIAMCKGVDMVDADCRLILSSGAIKHVRFVAHRSQALLADKYDEATPEGTYEYVGALMDVTESRRTQEALHQSMRDLSHVARLSTLGELAASIAHEVSQPIAAVVTNGGAALRWLKRAEPNFEEGYTAIENMIRDAQRSNDVVRRVRALAQKREAQFHDMLLNDIVTESIELLRREFEAQGVRLGLDLAPELPPVHIDKIQIQQVVINLLMNAVQAMANVPRASRMLSVTTHAEPLGAVRFAVTDRGPGLTPEIEKRLFSPFFSTKTDGMGMGLVIARSIIESHGGSIRLHSEPGQGTTADFLLPPHTKV